MELDKSWDMQHIYLYRLVFTRGEDIDIVSFTRGIAASDRCAAAAWAEITESGERER